jgi:hypothetical protein
MPAKAGTGLYLRFAPTKPLRVLAPDGVTIPSAWVRGRGRRSPRGVRMAGTTTALQASPKESR